MLVAKLSTGELAFGDQWYRGRTNNPWNPAEGSSGSSAGSGAATAAGLVSFAIGTDTGGSILSPRSAAASSGSARRSAASAGTASWPRAGRSTRSARCAEQQKTARSCSPRSPDRTGRTSRCPSGIPFGWSVGFDVRRLRVGYVPEIARGGSRSRRAGGARDRPRPRSSAPAGQLLPINVPQSDLSYYIDTPSVPPDSRRSSATGHASTIRQRHAQRAARVSPGTGRRLPAGQPRAPQTDGIVRARHPRRRRRDRGQGDARSRTSLNPLTSMTGHPAVAVPSDSPAAARRTVSRWSDGLYDEATLLDAARLLEPKFYSHGRRPQVGGPSPVAAPGAVPGVH